MQAPEIYVAFFAGLLSFLSPCVLPLVPAYLGYMSGAAIRQTKVAPAGGRGVATRTAAVPTGSARLIMLVHALLFVLGLVLVLAVFGGIAMAFRDTFFEYKQTILLVMGILLIIFGIFMMGVVNIPFLNYTRRLDIKPADNLGYLRSFLIGLGFGVGWTPCVGPALSLIFTMAFNGRQGEALLPFVAYSLGLGVPFLVVALAMGQISPILKKITRRSFTLKIGNWTVMDQVNVVSVISGLLLIFMGVLIATNTLSALAPNITWFNV